MKYSDMQTYYREGKFGESRIFSVCFYVFFAVAVIFLIIVPYFVFQTVPVLQDSMRKTIIGGTAEEYEDKVGLSMFSGAGRGDIIVFKRREADGEKRLVKRILACPGDKIRVADRGGRPAVQVETEENGLRTVSWLDEPYLNDEYGYVVKNRNGNWIREHCTSDGWLTLGGTEYFVAGDNREVSLDSFSFGPIQGSQIEGRVLCIYVKCGKFLFLDVYKAKGTGETLTLVPAAA